MAGKELGGAVRVGRHRRVQLEDVASDRREDIRGRRAHGDKRGKIDGAVAVRGFDVRPFGLVMVHRDMAGHVGVDAMSRMMGGRVLVLVRVDEGRRHRRHLQ